MKPKDFRADVEIAIREKARKSGRTTLRKAYYYFTQVLHRELESDTKLSQNFNYHTRKLREEKPELRSMIEDPERIFKDFYFADYWLDIDGVPKIVEIWSESKGMLSNIEPLGRKYKVNVLASKGYESWAQMDEAAVRFKGKKAIIIYLGDLNPSGMDAENAIRRYLGSNVEVKRVAITLEQVKKYGLKPKPAKSSDPRYFNYLLEHGDYSFECEALDDEVIEQVLIAALNEEIPDLEKRAEFEIDIQTEVDAYNAADQALEAIKDKLQSVAVATIKETLATSKKDVVGMLKEGHPVSLKFDESMVQDMVQSMLQKMMVGGEA